MVFLVESDKWRTAKEVAGRAARRVRMWLLGLRACKDMLFGGTKNKKENKGEMVVSQSECFFKKMKGMLRCFLVSAAWDMLCTREEAERRKFIATGRSVLMERKRVKRE